jgi:hypothetical protein
MLVALLMAGFRFADIKPRNRSQMLKLNSQIANWNLGPGRFQAITYDQLGNVFMGF